MKSPLISRLTSVASRRIDLAPKHPYAQHGLYKETDYTDIVRVIKRGYERGGRDDD